MAILEHMFVTLSDLEHELREIEAATAKWLARVAIYDQARDYTLDGYANTACAIRSVCHLNPGVARGHVDLARKLRSLPVVTAAFERGDITRAHAVVVANAYTPERADDLNHLETVFVDAAHELDPNALAVVVRRATDAIDGDGGAADDNKKHARRKAHLSRTFDQMGVLDALFDPDDTDYLERALKTEMDHDRAAGDRRTITQRRADAFMNLIRRGTVRVDIGATRPVSRHFVVPVDVEDFYSPQRIAELRLEVRDHGNLSTATLERIACDAQISRVIMAGKSEVLDVGRTTRTVNTALWAALVARDQHCQAPGCTRPPAECQAHHKNHWAHGGPTSLHNLELLCWKHHRQRHHDDAAPHPGQHTSARRPAPAPDLHPPRTRIPTPAPRRLRT